MNARAKKLPDPVAGNDGEALQRIADFFKAKFPDEWEELRLCPLQHGLDELVKLLRG